MIDKELRRGNGQLVPRMECGICSHKLWNYLICLSFFSVLLAFPPFLLHIHFSFSFFQFFGSFFWKNYFSYLFWALIFGMTRQSGDYFTNRIQYIIIMTRARECVIGEMSVHSSSMFRMKRKEEMDAEWQRKRWEEDTQRVQRGRIDSSNQSAKSVI